MDVSVVVPTANRPDALARLLEGLARQTFPRDRFEVAIADDGSDPPVAPIVAAFQQRLDVRCVWQPRSGPAKARNRAIALSSGRLLLILNDDAGVPPDLIERHVDAHAKLGKPAVFLGAFDLAPDCLNSVGRALLELGLPFPFHQMDKTGENPGRFFWTCNLSVPRDDVVALGGFDESFAQPVSEDVELGMRLDRRGLKVRWLADAACLHHHVLTATWFAKRQIELGRAIVKLWHKHRDPETFPWLTKVVGGDEAQLAAILERHARANGAEFLARAAEIDARDGGRGATTAAEMRALDQAGVHAGLFAGLVGFTTAQLHEWYAKLPALTSIVVAPRTPREALEKLRLRACAPVEIVDFAACAGDASPRGESIAKRARGERVCLVEPGFEGEPAWLLRELAATPRGVVARPGRFRLLPKAALAGA